MIVLSLADGCTEIIVTFVFTHVECVEKNGTHVRLLRTRPRKYLRIRIPDVYYNVYDDSSDDDLAPCEVGLEKTTMDANTVVVTQRAQKNHGKHECVT